MGAEISGQRGPARTFLGSLRRDRRGNTLAMMAIFLIPASGLAGSAIDTARLYVVKVRLQQACDAGVLAGRKFMDDTNTTTTLDSTATARANTFFANNFRSGWMKTNTVVFTPTKTSDSQVNGTATVVVPMTIMKMFGATDATLRVTCKAKFDVADTDIIFVLDTTGSMACLPADTQTTCDTYVVTSTKQTYIRPTGTNAVTSYAGSTGFSVPERVGSRISALRTAVLNFYDTFVANADPSTNVRYGFVTYSSLVNGGGAIMQVSPGSVVGSASAESATYQSRRITGEYVNGTTNTNNGKTVTNCTAPVVRAPTPVNTFDPSTGTATRTFDNWNGTVCKTRVETLIPQWTYGSTAWPVQQFVAGTAIADPTKIRGEMTQWLGCLEEPAAATTPNTLTFATTALPADLNPDRVRTAADNNRWIPHWQDVTYARNVTGTAPYAPTFTSQNAITQNGDNAATSPNYGSQSLLQNFQSVCGKPIQRLSVLTRTQVSNFVTAADFAPHGNTSHDLGMIWGTRLLSPGGLFANDTAAWPNRNAPNRVIVFMTDGDMQPSPSAYGMYGIEYFDRRVMGSGTSSQTAYHNARFLAECAAAKARNINIWTVQIDTSASPEMQSCATTSNQALFSTTGAGLSTAFTTIAQRLAMLRLTQ